jgi:hypothetical protein
VKSAPPCEVSRPTTFSTTTVSGPRPSALSASISFQKPKKAEDRPPCRPARAPARLKSWQGLDAQARSAWPGRSAGAIFQTSPSWK